METTSLDRSGCEGWTKNLLGGLSLGMDLGKSWVWILVFSIFLSGVLLGCRLASVANSSQNWLGAWWTLNISQRHMSDMVTNATGIPVAGDLTFVVPIFTALMGSLSRRRALVGR